MDENMMQNGPEQGGSKGNKPAKTGAQKVVIGISVVLGVVLVAFIAIICIGNSMINQGRVDKDASAFEGFMAFVKGTDASKDSSSDTKVVDGSENASSATNSDNDGSATGNSSNNSSEAGNSGDTDIEPGSSAGNTTDTDSDSDSSAGNTTDTDSDAGNSAGTTGDGAATSDGAEDSANTGSSDGTVSERDSIYNADGTIYYNKEHYVSKLGQYKDIAVDYAVSEVTEDDIDYELDNFCQQYADHYTLTEGEIEMYDEVSFSCIGYVEGELDDGCTIEEGNVYIGSGQMIAGFEESMVGHSIGDSYTVDLVFPDDYYEEYAGKNVTFTITIHGKDIEEIPELTDELIAENTECSTIAEYREQVRTELEEAAVEEAEEQMKADIVDILIGNCEYTDGINQAIEDDYEYALEYYDNSFNSYYGADAATIYEMYFGISADEYREMVHSDSERSVKYFSILVAIAENEGITITQEEYDAKFEDVFFDYYGFSSKEEVYECITEVEASAYVTDPIVQDKVEALIFGSAAVNGK